MTRQYICALALVLTGCKRSSEPAEKPSATPPPVEVRIEVEVAGRPAPPIDAARLAAVKPDFVEGDKRAWRLGTLIDGAAGHGIEVEDKDGVKTTFPTESDAGTHEPMLYLNKHGDVLVTMLNAAEPFPPFHGRGGNRGRPPGDASSQRIHGVRRIRVLSP
jgi:hypothetical protein